MFQNIYSSSSILHRVIINFCELFKCEINFNFASFENTKSKSKNSIDWWRLLWALSSICETKWTNVLLCSKHTIVVFKLKYESPPTSIPYCTIMLYQQSLTSHHTDTQFQIIKLNERLLLFLSLVIFSA